jgi:hypothetical protein
LLLPVWYLQSFPNFSTTICIFQIWINFY